MIIKGSARGQSVADTLRLARHLVAVHNETVTVLEMRGTVADALPEALEEMRLLSLATRSRRALEQRWRLAPVTGVHSRPSGIPRPVAAATHRCWQAEARTGVTVAEVAAALRRCWDGAENGRAFAVATHLAGLRLARGRRGIVAVDPMGTPHALPRRLGLTAAEVRHKLADLDINALPTVEDTQAAIKRHTNPGRITMPNTPLLHRPPTQTAPPGAGRAAPAADPRLLAPPRLRRRAAARGADGDPVAHHPPRGPRRRPGAAPLRRPDARGDPADGGCRQSPRLGRHPLQRRLPGMAAPGPPGGAEAGLSAGRHLVGLRGLGAARHRHGNAQPHPTPPAGHPSPEDAPAPVPAVPAAEAPVPGHRP